VIIINVKYPPTTGRITPISNNEKKKKLFIRQNPNTHPTLEETKKTRQRKNYPSQ
jgi:hypothetical protein